MSSLLGRFEILGRQVAVACCGPLTLEPIDRVYGPLSSGSVDPDLSYSIIEEPDGYFRLVRDGANVETATDVGDLLQAFDGDLTVELQKLRPDLFFLHSGVMSWGERAVLLVADSGVGKSTTCWGLSHLGAALMSDELAPLDLETLTVLPYLRAIGLKQEPPSAFPLPRGVLRTEWTIHLPLDLLPGGVRRHRTMVGAVVFLLAAGEGEAKPEIQQVSAAETATRLYACALNPLAHSIDGLEAVSKIGEAAPGFVLERGELGSTCELIRETFGGSVTGQARCPRPLE